MAVETVLQSLELPYEKVELGRAMLVYPLAAGQKKELIERLAYYKLELVENRVNILLERVKNEITRLLQAAQPTNLKLSAHLSKVLEYNYTYLANIFSQEEGMTLEKYYITQRIERSKELMIYEDLSLTHIADELHYSSVSHFCLQFKKVTGLTPAEFKKRCQSESYMWRDA